MSEPDVAVGPFDGPGDDDIEQRFLTALAEARELGLDPGSEEPQNQLRSRMVVRPGWAPERGRRAPDHARPPAGCLR